MVKGLIFGVSCGIIKITKLTITQAQTATYIQGLLDKQRIEAENYQETLQIERENLKNDGEIKKLKKTIAIISVVGGVVILGLALLLFL